jgi:hypothetical protein
MIGLCDMGSLRTVVVAIPWSVIGNALVVLVVSAILALMLRNARMPLVKKLKARRAQEREAKRRSGLLEESVKAHLLPSLGKRGFDPAPLTRPGPTDQKAVGSFPSWGRLVRVRESAVDQVEIQFSSYGRAAFRINACAVPREGMMTAGGHKSAEECLALGVHDLETHARPWLRPALRALRNEPLGQWFSLWRFPLRRPRQADYDRPALRAAAIIPELDLALRRQKLGPHMRRLQLKPLPAEALERLQKLNAGTKADELGG